MEKTEIDINGDRSFRHALTGLLGEHLVVVELLRAGYEAWAVPSPMSISDVMFRHPSIGLVEVQVKTTATFHKKIDGHTGTTHKAIRWKLEKDYSGVDLMAFVSVVPEFEGVWWLAGNVYGGKHSMEATPRGFLKLLQGSFRPAMSEAFGFDWLDQKREEEKTAPQFSFDIDERKIPEKK